MIPYSDEYAVCPIPAPQFITNTFCDCSDEGDNVSYGAFEKCDSIDNDCDGRIDEELELCEELIVDHHQDDDGDDTNQNDNGSDDGTNNNDDALVCPPPAYDEDD